MHYRAKLNRLATAGFATRDSLLTHQVDICTKIWEFSGEDTGAGKQMRRLFLSAIFWILHERPLNEKQTYYEEFQKAKDNYTAPTVEVCLWRDISGCAPYQAHPSGSIRRCWKNKNTVLKPTITNLGYKNIALSISGKRINHSVARLVAGTFIPNPDNKPEVDHINNDPGDNRIENLRWVDRAEQMKNRRSWSADGTKHVYKRGNRWHVILTRDKKIAFQSLYDTQEAAIRARDDFIKSSATALT